MFCKAGTRQVWTRLIRLYKELCILPQNSIITIKDLRWWNPHVSNCYHGIDTCLNLLKQLALPHRLQITADGITTQLCWGTHHKPEVTLALLYFTCKSPMIHASDPVAFLNHLIQFTPPYSAGVTLTIVVIPEQSVFKMFHSCGCWQETLVPCPLGLPIDVSAHFF